MPVKWGLIGASIIARDWVVAAIRTAGGEVTAVLSGDPLRARTFAEQGSIAFATASLDEFLASGIDAVYISTTNEHHCRFTLAAAAAGKHVLCEKPLALSLEDAERMVAACHAAGVVMATNHHLRNAGIFRAMRSAVAAGAVGRLLFARVFHAVRLPVELHGWRLRSGGGAGVFLDLTVHDADSLRFVLAEEPIEVAAFAQSGSLASSGVADGAMGIIRFRSGLVAQFHDAFTTAYAPTGVEIHGTDGSLIAHDCLGQRPIGNLVLRDRHGETAIPSDDEDLYVRGLRSFHNAIAGRGRPACTGEDGVASLSVALAAARSAETHEAVRIGSGRRQPIGTSTSG